MAREKSNSEAKETVKARKERAIHALESDEFLEVVAKEIDSRGSVYIGREYAGQDAVVLILKRSAKA